MRDTCTPIGDWFYFWQSRRLVRADASDELVVHPRLRAAFELGLRTGRGTSWLALALALRPQRKVTPSR